MKIDETNSVKTIILEDNDKIKVITNNNKCSNSINLFNKDGRVNINNVNALNKCNKIIDIFKDNYRLIQRINYNQECIRLIYHISGDNNSITLDKGDITAFIFSLDSRCVDIFNYLRVGIMKFLVDNNYYEVRMKNNGIIHILPNDNRIEDTNIDVFSDDYQFLVNEYNGIDNTDFINNLSEQISSDVDILLDRQIIINEIKRKELQDYIQNNRLLRR